MSVGGPRAVLLGALLVTVGFVPVTAAQENCAGAGPAELCVDDPLVHDAGEIRLAEGDLSATANGGVATGAGSATFSLDYVADASTISQGEIRLDGQLAVYDGEGNLVDREAFTETLFSGDDVEDEIHLEIATIGPLADEGTVEVSAQAYHWTADTRSTIGHAQSVSPITYVVAPPSDVAERTTVGSTVDVGSFDVGPSSETADTIDGELLVAGDTTAKLEASGELSSDSFTDVDDLNQRATARLNVRSQDFDVNERVSVQPIYDDCIATCSVDARTVPVELSVVVHGDVEDPIHGLDIRLSGDWTATWHDGTSFRFDGAHASDDGANDLLVVGS